MDSNSYKDERLPSGGAREPHMGHDGTQTELKFQSTQTVVVYMTVTTSLHIHLQTVLRHTSVIPTASFQKAGSVGDTDSEFLWKLILSHLTTALGQYKYTSCQYPVLKILSTLNTLSSLEKKDGSGTVWKRTLNLLLVR